MIKNIYVIILVSIVTSIAACINTQVVFKIIAISTAVLAANFINSGLVYLTIELILEIKKESKKLRKKDNVNITKFDNRPIIEQLDEAYGKPYHAPSSK